MTRYQVDSEAVQAATGAIRGSMGRIQSEVNGLQGQLTGLNESWSGQAASAFQAVAAEWHTTQLRVEESLAAINQALSVAAQQYADAESSNARLFAH